MVLPHLIIQVRYYKVLCEKAILALTDEDLFFKGHKHHNSIATIMMHIAGNLKSRFTDFKTSDGEKVWRKRDNEFLQPNLSRTELLSEWETAWKVLFDTLSALKESDMQSTVSIRGENHTIVQAMLRQLAHYSYHIGQIVYAAKNMLGNTWQSLSIPLNESEKFNVEFKTNKKQSFRI